MAETNWSDVVGQKQLTDNLRSALKYNKISHAYLIQGERLSGKMMIADIFARALQCEGYKAPSEYQATLFDSEEQNSDISMKIRPCNQCKFCKQALNENHPDIIYVTHEKPNVISVDNIRQQVNADIGIKPYSGDECTGTERASKDIGRTARIRNYIVACNKSGGNVTNDFK